MVRMGTFCVLVGNIVEKRRELGEKLLVERLRELSPCSVMVRYVTRPSSAEADFLQIPFVLHLPDRACHAGARQMQRVADVGHLDAHALALEPLDRVEILDIRRRDALRQRREQLTGALGLIAGVQQTP